MEKTSSFSAGALATSFISIAAMVTLLLTLAGYGIAISVESVFGIPHQTLYKSAIDLLSLSTWFLLWLMENLPKAFSAIALSTDYWLAGLSVAGLGLAIWLIFHFADWAIKKSKRTSPSASGRKPRLGLVGSSTLFAVASGATALLSAPLILMFMLMACTMLVIIPMISMSAGQAYIDKYVIQPSACQQVRTRAERISKAVKTDAKDKQIVATCVRIVEDDKIVAQGRVVFSSTESIILYDPDTGLARREPLENRTIESISDTDFRRPLEKKEPAQGGPSIE